MPTRFHSHPPLSPLPSLLLYRLSYRRDLSIDCNSGQHGGLVAYASVMIILIPIGVPLFYFALLYRRRFAIFELDRTKPLSPKLKEIELLISGFKTTPFYYTAEVIESFRYRYL